jgi:homoserine kinase
MGLYLTIDAVPATAFAIDATGRNADLCGSLENNLILDTYRDVLGVAGRRVTPLRLRIENEIPLGMGCGSSAAALLAGVYLANHFGELGWDGQRCMEEACWREGHPDNVAACALGYLTVSCAVLPSGMQPNPSVVAATCGSETSWKLLLALPPTSLATHKARALLPDLYPRADAVANVQRTGLLVSAFALNRGDLLATAMQDRMHQPYRMEACPLLGRLLPLSDEGGVLGVALSGAGPGVLLIADMAAQPVDLLARIRRAADDPSLEVVETEIAGGALAIAG